LGFLAEPACGAGKARRVALWGGNLIAAPLFGATHLPSAMLFPGLVSPLQVPGLAILGMLLLNGVAGIIAGERYLRDGLVAAVGVHLWMGLTWPVILAWLGPVAGGP